MLGAAAGEAGGSVLGHFLGASDRARAEKLRRRALEELGGDIGEWSDPSALAGVSTDPELRQAQMSALDQLAREGKAGGLSIESRAALREAEGETSARERGSREAILQDMARRGMSGSGNELAAALTNQQGAAERNSAAGTRAAADARARALQAMTQSGQLAGAVRGQDFGETTTRAGAVDDRNRFNATQRLQRAGMRANALTNNAVSYDASAARSGGLGAGVGAGLGAAAGYFYDRKKPAGGAG